MKVQVKNYVFNAVAKTITFSDYTTIDLDSILIIVNATSGNFLYNFADPLKGGTIAGNVLTLEAATTGMTNADKLLIYYDDAAKTTDTSGKASEAKLEAVRALLDLAIDATGRLEVSNMVSPVETDLAKNTKLETVRVLLEEIRGRLPSILDAVDGGIKTHVQNFPASTEIANDAGNPIPVSVATAELTERMLNKQPLVGKRLWFDTANASHIYILEADAAATATSTGFQGVRVTKDVDGNPVGKVQANVGATLTFTNRAADGGWF